MVSGDNDTGVCAFATAHHKDKRRHDVDERARVRRSQSATLALAAEAAMQTMTTIGE